MARRGSSRTSWGGGGRYWEEFHRPPRLPADGIKAQTQRGQFGKTWWAGRWIAALERLVDPGRLARGRSYARSGQVLTLDVGPDGVAAKVQGSQPTPYQVSIRFQPLSDAAWEQVADAMAAEALYAAKLLSGEMPAAIEEVFTAAGTSLFPSAQNDLQTDCSCPDWANPCKHVAAVHYLLGERFETDPFLIFVLRGRTQQQIAEALRARRAGGHAPVGTPDEAPLLEAAEETVPALAESLASYWSSPAGPADLHVAFDPPVLDALPVKRLGPPPFWPDASAFESQMDELYQAIGAHAYRLALGDEPS